MSDGISKYASDICKYVEANPSTRGVKKRMFTDKIEAMVQKQSIPSVLASGSAVMVTLGSDIGELHADEEKSFFEADGRAANACVACYNRFATWERSLNIPVDFSATKRLVQGNHLPFVDTFPWFTRDGKDYPAARKLLGEYLMQTKPIIVLTYGDLASTP